MKGQYTYRYRTNIRTGKSSLKNISERETNVLLVILLSILCAMSKYSVFLGIFVGIAETAFLVVVYLKKSLSKYLTYFLIIITTCLDTPLFVFGEEMDRLYSFTFLPVVHGYHIFLLLLLPLLKIFYFDNFKVFKRALKEYKELRRTLEYMAAIYFAGIIFSIVTILIDDNEAWGNLYFYLKVFKHQAFLYTCVLLLFLDFSYVFLRDEKFQENFKEILYSILLGICISGIFVYISGMESGFAEGTVLLLTQASFFSVSLVILPHYDIGNTVFSMIASLCMVFVMTQKASAFAGKWWLFVFLIVLVFISKVFDIKSKNLFAKFGGIMIIGLVLSILFFSNGINYIYGHSGYKLEQVYALLNFKENWYYLLPDSPKYRIEEFINILIEYCKKPYLSIFGKGISGSIQHHWGTLDWITNTSAFTEEEMNIGYYSYLHETINCLYLSSGALGLLFFIHEIKSFLKNFKENPWCVIGVVWFVFFAFSSYLSLWIGAVCLIYGKVDILHHKHKKEKNYECTLC